MVNSDIKTEIIYGLYECNDKGFPFSQVFVNPNGRIFAVNRPFGVSKEQITPDFIRTYYNRLSNSTLLHGCLDVNFGLSSYLLKQSSDNSRALQAQKADYFCRAMKTHLEQALEKDKNLQKIENDFHQSLYGSPFKGNAQIVRRKPSYVR